MPIGNMVRVYPHATRPGIIFPVVNNVDFKKYFAEISSYGKESSAVLYQSIISKFTTPSTIGQQWRGSVDEVDITNGQLAYYYYNIQAAYSFTREQEARASEIFNGVGLPDLLERLSRMAINQRRHYASLFGFDPSETQGIMKLGTVESMPADSDSHTTVTAYNVNELLAYLAEKARDVMSTSYGTLKPAIIASSPRVINYMKTAIVPVTSYLEGGGVDSVAGSYSRIASQWLGVGNVIFIEDYLLQGTGTGGDDNIVFIAPGLSSQEAVSEEYSQYMVEDLPSNAANTFMDVVGGLIKTQNPEKHRVISSDLSLKTTPGAVTRQDAVFIVEAAYE